ncbi:Fur family transcriptional regulator [Clostridium botulinum]|uniref:Fur family transcriptional regulator n=1 Tax=Clostridium botulinum TaxID=1491 RepID=A0A9Q1UZQ6_CLOBO|nr:Fur family transcriptional regulator [Clostridium botulinum]KEH99056.1 Fur family transcriptional regulator [Clostridium botulinum D str. 16868]KEI01182.1 Fur family transcriptional regulator [Clostridium botulinum C/D str. Sp77]KLU76383.1 Fur family transcriptional regulator [Clostridium botulinum V891]KOA73186.1 Fur family transcriptional regulator [Clostridium botulinum]KOA79686.1 Fur family transcriptional regulator [Clostridium botulinum]
MNIEKYLKENNIRSTRGRKSILKILIESEEPLDAEYIYDKCRQNKEKVDLSTVYRTLELLEQKDVINKFPLDDGRYNYILKCKWHKHTIKCDFCNKEVEIDCPMIQIKEIIKNKTGFTLLDEEFKFRCVCEECKKDNKNK